MSLKETFELINKNYPNLVYKSEYSAGVAMPYSAKNLFPLKEALRELSEIDFLKHYFDRIKGTKLFENLKDSDVFSSADDTTISSTVSSLKTGLDYLLNYYYSSRIKDHNVIQIKLPEVSNFDELSKVSQELKKSIELPIYDSSSNGTVEIITAESGSIWLIISLGTPAAVGLIAKICWSAAVIRKQRAMAKIFEAQAKTLELKNESLANLIDAQKIQLDNLVEAEAQAIANQEYNIKDPETIGRLKLSITTVADLIDRGTKILPQGESTDVKKLFPDYNNLDMITSNIKQITEGDNQA